MHSPLQRPVFGMCGKCPPRHCPLVYACTSGTLRRTWVTDRRCQLGQPTKRPGKPVVRGRASFQAMTPFTITKSTPVASVSGAP